MRTILSAIRDQFRLPRVASLTLATSTLLLTSCAGTGWMQPSPPIEMDDLATYSDLWAVYISDVNIARRQNDCEPRLIPATTSKRRGAVIMFHGFSGCPQQYFTLAGRVAEHGYDVLLPLHPGHGMTPDINDQDDLSRIPQLSDGQNRYAEFAIRMNEILAHSPGEKIVVGFSLGGAIALNASLNAPDLYDRQILLSPMLEIRGGATIEGLIDILGRTPGIRNMVVKSGSTQEACKGWKAAGRAGFCNYRLKDVITLLDLEDINQSLYKEQPITMPIQIIVAGGDNYVSNTRIRKLAEQQREHGPVSLCILPADVPHEMLSPYENIGRQMYWLGGLLDGATGFIVNGQFLASEIKENGQRTSIPDCQLTR